MTRKILKLLVITVLSLDGPAAIAAEEAAVQEQAIAGPGSVALKVRMEGPYTADVPLQIVCYFKYTEEGAKRMTGAPAELDKELGGLINTLRSRNEFSGNALETMLLI